MRMRTSVAGVVAGLTLWIAAAPVLAQEDAPESAVTWLGQPEPIEEFIRAAEVTNVEDIGVGVTNPKRADIVGDGPVDRISFKPLSPGIYRGYWESYKNEIAAYELDKLLDLGMTPPTVEKRVNGDLGAAAMWVAPTQSFKELGGPPAPPATHIGRFNYQLIRAKMFHNLIYNKDPNLGNWLVDPAWNLILIDNSRAFTPHDTMVHELTRVDRELWDRFEGLDESTLAAVLDPWLSDDQIAGILERRDKMAEDIAEMCEERGEAAVFVRFVPAFAPARSAPAARPAAADLQALDPSTGDRPADERPRFGWGGRLVDAVNEAPTLPRSELIWIGRVVRLADYRGPDQATATAGVAEGHAFGIVTELDGLLCLTEDQQNPEHYEMLTGLAGKRAEVFGWSTDDAGLTVVQVTLCREVR